jgi:signal transduction histidine kinase
MRAQKKARTWGAFTMSGKLGRYTAAFALLVVAIIAIAVGLLAVVLESSADRLDKQQLETQRLIVRSVVRRQLAKLTSNVTDYALWDDMYDRFAGQPDPQWDIENVGPYGATTFQLEHVAVFDAGGGVAYEYDRNNVAMSGGDRIRLARLTMPLIADARAGDLKASEGIVEFAGQAHYFVAHAIWVASEKRKAGNERPNFALVYLKALDRAYLAGAAGDFDLGGLRVKRGDAMVKLPAPGNEPEIFGLSWNPSQGGRQFISDSMGQLLAAAPVVAALLVGLAFGWASIVNQLRKSEMRTAQARLEAAEETSKAKSMFIANMSHEFRTPLNAINGFSDFLRNDMLGLGIHEKYKEYAGDIHSSGQHLLRIVNNLLLFSKIEAKQHCAQVQALSLAEEVASTFRMLAMVGTQRGVTLDWKEIPKSVMVLADQQSLVQIVVNIVANAVKFSVQGQTVTIDLVVAQGERVCELRVMDRGCGIPKVTLEQLGQPFVQAEDVYTRRVQGTGLGLALCFKLADQMGAKLIVDSVEGEGTTVTLRLPLAEDAPAKSYDERATETAIAAA